MNIEVDIKKWKKTHLTLSEYLLLAFLVNDSTQGLNHLELEIIEHLEELGYLRMIDDIPIVETKARKLFDGELDTKAKEVLDYLNNLKKEYYPKSRGFSYKIYGSEIKARLQEDVSVKDTKLMLKYIFKERVGTDLENYLTPTTLFNKKKFHNYVNMAEMNQSKSIDSVFERVEDD